MTTQTDRKQFIGASEISAVMGLSRWCTPLKLWALKTGKIEKEDAGEFAEWGTRLEPVVADKFAEKHNCKLIAYKKRYVHKEYPFLSCELDRIIAGTDELVEVKTCSTYVLKQWEGEEVPLEYTLQVNFQLGLSNRKTGYFAVLIGGNKYVEKKVTFDQELYDKQVEAAVRFWNEFVIPNVPPKAMGEDNDSLAEIYPASLGDALFFEGDEEAHIENLLADRSGAIEAITHAEEEINKIEAEIKQRLGSNQKAETSKYKITWNEQKRSSVDTTKLREAGLYEQYAKTSVIRVFRANEKKEK